MKRKAYIILTLALLLTACSKTSSEKITAADSNGEINSNTMNDEVVIEGQEDNEKEEEQIADNKELDDSEDIVIDSLIPLSISLQDETMLSEFEQLVASERDTDNSDSIADDDYYIDVAPLMEAMLPACVTSLWPEASKEFRDAVALFYGTEDLSRDIERAEELFTQAAAAGNADAYYFLSQIAWERKDYLEAWNQIQQAVAGDSALGYYRKGMMLVDDDAYLIDLVEECHGWQEDCDVAEEYLTKAVEKGLTDAYYGLGIIHDIRESAEHTIEKIEDGTIDWDFVNHEYELMEQCYAKARTGRLPETVADAYFTCAILGFDYYKNGYTKEFYENRSTALLIYVELAKRGNSEAWIQAGDVAWGYWDYGERMGTNPELEVACYLNASSMGSENAAKRLERITAIWWVE